MNRTKDVQQVQWNPYGDLPQELGLQGYQFVMQLRYQQTGIGQRSIAREIKRRFNITLSESTISGWIHQKNVPFANKRTQFQQKPMPSREILTGLYLINKNSASQIAHRFGVSIATAITWLRRHKIPTRTHCESMNTSSIKEELSQQHLKELTKDYQQLTRQKAYIRGVLCSEGYLDKKQIKLEIRYDKEFTEKCSNCLEKVYGLRYNPSYYAKRNTYIVGLSSMIIARDLLQYGDFRTMSWSVPEKVLNTKNRAIISLFIRGLYDSEGSDDGYNINFTSASSRGITELQKLLYDLGIKSRLRLTREKYYTLVITHKKNITLFRELIGFTIKRKMDKLFRMYKLDLRKRINQK